MGCVDRLAVLRKHSLPGNHSGILQSEYQKHVDLFSISQVTSILIIDCWVEKKCEQIVFQRETTTEIFKDRDEKKKNFYLNSKWLQR